MLESLLISQSDQTMTMFAKEEEPHRWDRMSIDGFRTILLVEYRDEVFARLADDLTTMGMWVERACSTAEAFRWIVGRSPDLVIVNADMPNGGGWLLAAKLRLSRPTARIWLYAPRPRSFEYDHALARFLGVAELIHYQGDLFLLAEEIRRRLTRLPHDTILTAREIA